VKRAEKGPQYVYFCHLEEANKLHSTHFPDCLMLPNSEHFVNSYPFWTRKLVLHYFRNWSFFSLGVIMVIRRFNTVLWKCVSIPRMRSIGLEDL